LIEVVNTLSQQRPDWLFTNCTVTGRVSAGAMPGRALPLPFTSA
jgi:hypothetical protein